jgi:TRAP-type mannitol/chloroaromatic compound transport system substrate-binding protein
VRKGNSAFELRGVKLRIAGLLVAVLARAGASKRPEWKGSISF